MQSRNVIPGVPNTKRNPVESFSEVDPYFPERNLMITGITKDSTGAALGNCDLQLIDAKTADRVSLGASDANGNYTIQIPKGLSQPQVTTWKIDAYKAGLPDLAGTTVNTLVGT